MKKVYVIHGYGASPDKHWFPWLEKKLGEIGVDCIRLEMPDSENPHCDKWLTHLENHIQVDENTILVGHSLGCIASLNFLAKHYAQPLAAILVSGFYQPISTLPELAAFSNLYAILPPCMPFKSYVIASLDDTIVPHTYSDELAKHLKADYIRLPTGGHFLDREGVTEFPLVLDIISKLYKEEK